MAVTRQVLRQLVDIRLAEAALLPAQGLWSGAYYLGGYAVECGLKAVIARRFEAEATPELRPVRDVHTHRLYDLVKLAELGEALPAEQRDDPVFKNFWHTALEWDSQSRYRIVGRGPAQVLQWIRRFW